MINHESYVSHVTSAADTRTSRKCDHGWEARSAYCPDGIGRMLTPDPKQIGIINKKTKMPFPLRNISVGRATMCDRWESHECAWRMPWWHRMCTPRVQNLTGGSVNSSTGPAYRQIMGQFDHMAEHPSGCPRLDGGVNYGHFDPQGGPSNHRRGPIAVRHPGILITTWRHGRHLDNMAPCRQDARVSDGGITVAWETNQAWRPIKLGGWSSSASDPPDPNTSSAKLCSWRSTGHEDPI
jgi:hypothetical protein